MLCNIFLGIFSDERVVLRLHLLGSPSSVSKQKKETRTKRGVQPFFGVLQHNRLALYRSKQPDKQNFRKTGSITTTKRGTGRHKCLARLLDLYRQKRQRTASKLKVEQIKDTAYENK